MYSKSWFIFSFLLIFYSINIIIPTANAQESIYSSYLDTKNAFIIKETESINNLKYLETDNINNNVSYMNNKKEFRYLPSSNFYTTCSPPISPAASSVYAIDATDNVIRSSDRLNDAEKFLLYSKAGSITFSSNLFKKHWQVKLREIGDGLIFLGVCGFDNTSATTCGDVNDKDKFLGVYFSGLSITYFGTDCYHIDHYVNGYFWATVRHCLSVYELKNMTFSFQFAYDTGANGDNGILRINYDGYQYYERMALKVKQDTLNGKILNMFYPCATLFIKNTKIQFFDQDTYPYNQA
jgi:hypothetical protein